MWINRELLLKVHNLELYGIIDKMNDVQFADFCETLNKFIEGFPALENKLKTSFEAKERGSFVDAFSTVPDTLKKIYANSLAQTSVEILREVKAGRYEAAEARLIDFLATVSALSIDLQIAQTRSQAEYKPEIWQTSRENRQKSILAVDDMPFLLGVLKAALMNTTYKFTGVVSGKDALKFIESHKPDLFILDIEMPKMDGYELAKRIRWLGHTAPIIFLTGNASQEYVLRAIKVGASDFIVKPVNKEQVIEKIKKYIGS